MSAPGQSVSVPSRWPLTTRKRHVLPAAKLGLPPEVIVASTERIDVCDVEPPRDQRDERLRAPASVSAALSPLPITAMPTLPVLKPSVCAPTTGRSMPPSRPS